MKIKLSKSQWQFIGKKAGWMKKSQQVRWFDWQDNSGEKWNISYRDIDPKEMYENGKALSDKAIMVKMIVGIQSEYSDEKLPKRVIPYWVDKIGIDTQDFFEEVQQANHIFEDEQRIERSDVDSGLIDLDILEE